MWMSEANLVIMRALEIGIGRQARSKDINKIVKKTLK